MSDNESAFKNWINSTVVYKYSLGIDYKFNKEFNKISKQLDSLELRDRVRLIATTLKKYLPEDFPKAVKQLLKNSIEQEMKSFELWPATEFIQIYGLNHIDDSLDAIFLTN